ALFDCPDLVHELLQLVTYTYIDYMRKWKEFINEKNDFSTHWRLYTRGGIMIRNDTAVMLSPEQYDEFVKPYDQKLFDEFGGSVHFCGKGDFFIESMCRSRNLYGINVSQPELNNMDLILKSCAENKIPLIGIDENLVPENAKTGYIVYRSTR
ncbi:MAG: hypothetical protein ABIA63_12100, partial [bacterium]